MTRNLHPVIVSPSPYDWGEPDTTKFPDIIRDSELKIVLPSDSLPAAKEPRHDDPPMPYKVVAASGHLWEYLTSRSALGKLAEKGYTVCVRIASNKYLPQAKAGDANPSPCDVKYGIPFINGAFLKPGDKVDVSQVFRYHSMNAEQKYRPAWHRSPDQLNGIILSLWWKNDEIGLKKIVEKLEKEEEFQSMSAWIGGSGGIPLKPGSYPVSDLSNIDRHEVQSVGTLESPQNISDSQSMFKAAIRGAILPLYVPDDDKKSSLLQYIGTICLQCPQFHRDSWNDLIEELEGGV